VLLRSEWRDERRSFDRLDQDNNGRVTRDEYLSPPAVDDRESRFDVLDRNNDGRVSRGEWRNEPLSFARVDLNNDGIVSFREYWDRGLADDDYSWGDRFRSYDRNGDNLVTRSEWAGDTDTFNVLDVSRNGRLERAEINNPSGLRARFRVLDTNRDGWVELREWRASRTSFDFFDRDNDGRLSDQEYVGVN
jgi:Ca2+-binding EF-hand superfamily protein